MRGDALAIAALAALFLLRSGSAQPVTDRATQDTSGEVLPDVAANADQVQPSNVWDDASMLPNMNGTPEQNVTAFLRMVRCCEHRYPDNVQNDLCYQIMYGGGEFFDLSDHPVITGEKQKVLFTESQCKSWGFTFGKGGSTAAGAYQIIRPTWDQIRGVEPRLPDFSPASQDEAARRLLMQCGALSLIEAGDIEGALAKACKLWASLPGSTANQNPKLAQFALDRFYEGLA